MYCWFADVTGGGGDDGVDVVIFVAHTMYTVYVFAMNMNKCIICVKTGHGFEKKKMNCCIGGVAWKFSRKFRMKTYSLTSLKSSMVYALPRIYSPCVLHTYACMLYGAFVYI